MSQRKGPKRWTGKAWVFHEDVNDRLPLIYLGRGGSDVKYWVRVRVTITPLRPRRHAAKGKR